MQLQTATGNASCEAKKAAVLTGVSGCTAKPSRTPAANFTCGQIAEAQAQARRVWYLDSSVATQIQADSLAEISKYVARHAVAFSFIKQDSTKSFGRILIFLKFIK